MKKLSLSFKVFISTVVISISCISSIAAASVDPAYIPVLSKAYDFATTRQLLQQADGKIVVWGGSNVVEGKAKGQIYRLNADGSLDNGFSYCSCNMTEVYGLFLQSDGKYVIMGYSGAGGFTSVPKIMRINANGDVDPTYFSEDLSAGISGGWIKPVGIQPDDKVLALRHRIITSGAQREYRIFRYNADGTTDATFTPIAWNGNLDLAVTGYQRMADGRAYISWWTRDSANVLATQIGLYNTDGTPFGGFTSPTLTPANNSYIFGIGLLSDNSLVMVGRITTVNGLTKLGLAKMLPAGNIDASYGSSAFSQIESVVVLPGDKVLTAINPSLSAGTLKQYDVAGALDASFSPAAAVANVKSNIVMDSSGRAIILGGSGSTVARFYRLLSTGVEDAGFNPNAGVSVSATKAAFAPDGKMYVTGLFTQVNGVAKSQVARLNVDGTLDTSFDIGAGFSSAPAGVSVQADGKVVAYGSFTSLNSVTHNSIARLNSDGSADGTFVPSFSTGVSGVGFQSTGKIIAYGSFNTVNSVSRPRIARLNTDGTLDSWGPVFSGTITSLVVDPDDKIAFTGTFSGVDGFSRTNIARLTAAGANDTTFVPPAIAANLPIVRQSTGKYIYRNDYVLSRLNADGSADATLNAALPNSGGSVSAFALGTDDSMYLSGTFTTMGGVAKRNIAHLSADGVVDQAFTIGMNAGAKLVVMGPQSKMYVFGDFFEIDLRLRAGMARLNLQRHSAPFDLDGDGKADVAVYRPSQGCWYLFRSSDNVVTAAQFGLSTDVAVPADYDGDGKTDHAIFRPSTGDWWYRSSLNGTDNNYHWGMNGDLPLAADYDGDGRADRMVVRNYVWYFNGNGIGTQFGAAGDRPVVGDFDGDGKSDIAIYRPTTGDWWYQSSIDSVQRAIHWGQAGDVPVPADFDGDGKTDCAVFRPGTGGWWILNSHDLSVYAIQFGLSDDLPAAADYDGDGKADIAVFRPSNGVWYQWRSTSGFSAMQFGTSGDVPAPNVFIH